MDGQLIQQWMKSCRLCLLDDGVKLPIFGEEGIVREVAQKIQTCFPMIVLYNADPLSKIICQRCLFMLDTVYNFRQKCVETNQVFTSHLTALKSNSSSVKQYLLALEKNGSIPASGRPSIPDAGCPSIPSSVRTSVSAAQIQKTIRKPDLQKPADLPNQRSALASYRIRNPDDKLCVEPMEKDPLGMPNLSSNLVRIKQEVIDCSDGSSSGKSTPLIISVVGSYSDAQIEEGRAPVTESAPVVREKLPGTVKVKQESQLLNPKVQSLLKTFKVITPWYCKFCNKYYKSKDTQYKHRRYFCPYKAIPCKICNQIFKSENEMLEHSALHLRVFIFLKDEDLHPCQVCDKRFANGGMLSAHMQTHTGSPNRIMLRHATSDNLAALRKNPTLQMNSLKNFRKRILKSRYRRGNTLPKVPRSQCPYCPCSYARMGKLTYHKKRLHLEEYLEELEMKKEMSQKAAAAKAARNKNPVQKVLPEPVPELASESVPVPMEVAVAQANRSNVIRTALHRPGPLSKQRAKRPVSHGLLRDLLNKRILKCPICSRVFGSAVGLQNHMRSHNNGSPMGPKAFRCNLCGRLFGTKGGLTYHTATQHTEGDTCNDAYRCQPCHITFPSRTEWIHHKLSHNKGNKLNKKAKPAVKAEGVVAERPKLLLCCYCNQVFSESAELKAHQLTHKAAAASAPPPPKMAPAPAPGWGQNQIGEMWPCSLCTKVCSTKRNLRRHTKTHELRAHCSHHCNLCSKKFISKAALVRHDAFTHSTAKSFRCQKCSKIFFRKGSYLNHLNTTCERPARLAETGAGGEVAIPSEVPGVEVPQPAGASQMELCLKCGFTRTVGHKCDLWMAHSQPNPVKRPGSRRSYRCRVCGATFASSYSHNSHMKAHVNQNHRSKLILKVPTALRVVPNFEDVPLLEESFVHPIPSEILKNNLSAPLDLSYVEPAAVFTVTSSDPTPPEADQPDVDSDLLHLDSPPTNGSCPSFGLGEHMFFQCVQCTKTFHSQQGLSAHVLSHEGNTSNLFQCSFCSRECSDSQALNLHILLNHPDIDVIKDSEPSTQIVGS